MIEWLRRKFTTETKTAPEPPVYSEIEETEDDPRLFQASFGGKQYQVEAVGTLEGFKSWFDDYSEKGPACESCERLIFPEENVGRLNDGGLRHLTEECSPDGAGTFVGSISSDGVLEPAFGGRNILEHVLESGNEVVVNFGPRGAEIEESHPKPRTLTQ